MAAKLASSASPYPFSFVIHCFIQYAYVPIVHLSTSLSRSSYPFPHSSLQESSILYHTHLPLIHSPSRSLAYMESHGCRPSFTLLIITFYPYPDAHRSRNSSAAITPGRPSHPEFLRRHYTRTSPPSGILPPPFHPDISHPGFCLADVLPSPDVSHPESHFVNSFKSWYSNSPNCLILYPQSFFRFKNHIFNKALLPLLFLVSNFHTSSVFKMF